MRPRVSILAALLAAAAATAVAQQAGQPVPIALGRDFGVDAPPTWSAMTGIATASAFLSRNEAQVIAGVQRVGQRPTDMPYAIVEEWRPDLGLVSPSNMTQAERIEQIVEYYRTALNPPSKADRPTPWRKSRVSAVRYDLTGQQFRFDATLTYDVVGDVHVVVSGLFDRQRVLIFSGWSDDAFDAAHPGELSAIRDSLHLIGLNAASVVSPGAWLRGAAQVVVAIAVVAVIVLQIIVWRRDRRAHAGEDAGLI